MKLSIQEITSTLTNIEHEIFNIEKEYISLSNVKLVNSSDCETLTWINDKFDDVGEIYQSQWGLVVSSNKGYEKLVELGAVKFPVLVTKEPKHVFSIIAKKFLLHEKLAKISEFSSIDPEAIIGANVTIGAFTVIGKCSIAENSVIGNNCTISDNVVIGRHVIINDGSVIGGKAFIFTKNFEKRYERFPAFGGVILEDFVEIGANNTIDRGSVANTVLKKGVKMDNLVHISHDVVINENTLIIANTTIAGHTIIGANSRVSPSSSILQRLNIGDNVHIGTGAVVNHDIPSSNVYLGNPAIEISKFAKLEREKRRILRK